MNVTAQPPLSDVGAWADRSYSSRLGSLCSSSPERFDASVLRTTWQSGLSKAWLSRLK